MLITIVQHSEKLLHLSLLSKGALDKQSKFDFFQVVLK